MYEKTFTHCAAKYTVDIMLFGGIFAVLSIPFLPASFFNWFGYRCGDSIFDPLKLTLFTSGICIVYILCCLRNMFRTLMQGNPFSDVNINYFRKMAVSSALISIIYFVKLFYMFTIATVFIIIAFAVASLFCLTLKDLFKQASVYKEENELTI